MSLGNLAVKYLLQFDMVSTVLPAMNSVEEVLENCRASGDGSRNCSVTIPIGISVRTSSCFWTR